MSALSPQQDPTLEAVWRAYEQAQDSGHRRHLGFSLLGQECERASWYTFRWAQAIEHSGRMLALFERGQLEEWRFVRDLQSVGVIVWDTDPETGGQWRVEYLGGHVGGSLDGIAQGLLDRPQLVAGCEFKTHKSSSFRELQRKGVRGAKPVHYDQMQGYMILSRQCLGVQLDAFYYLAVNKDTDERYAEWVEFNPARGEALLRRAERIVNSWEPPARVSRNPTYLSCKMCDFANICHRGDAAERNCRTCVYAQPNTQTGAWVCSRHNAELSDETQRRGCPDHRYLPGFVPGDAVAADQAANTITYRFEGGHEWTDTGPDEAATHGATS